MQSSRYYLRGTLSLGNFCETAGRFEVTPVTAVSERSLSLG
jgi:hypothetical protein